jgi:prepilin-type N-terminal cleavage/methylation domain-containing protein
MNKKGFTLVELLVVIGVLGVLAAAVVVVLNPAELLKQARDGQRLSDLSNINAALAFYASDVASPTFGTTAYHSGATTTSWTCGDTDNAVGRGSGTSTLVNSNGWVAVNLASSTGGSPLSVLPTDPTNDITYHYCYKGDDANKKWELTAGLESVKYATTLNYDGVDGGDDNNKYELGTDPGLDLIS